MIYFFATLTTISTEKLTKEEEEKAFTDYLVSLM